MGRAGAEQDGWCILRTSGGKTLALAKSLAEAGYDAWSPAETKTVRLPQRQKGAKVEKTFPIMPTFVFVRALHLGDLALILALPINPHPGFSIFRYLGRIPLLADRDIEGLRTAERRAIPKARMRTFAPGAPVRVPEGCFAGMSGSVKKSNGKYTLVCFGRKEVKIATFVLLPDDVDITDTPHEMRQRASA